MQGLRLSFSELQFGAQGVKDGIRIKNMHYFLFDISTMTMMSCAVSDYKKNSEKHID
jgi:hypothetical protein